MTQSISLHVSFPKFGKNYYSQHVVVRKNPALLIDERFDDFLIESASLHFNNGVIGLNDQFRFLNDILANHLMELDARPASRHSQQNRQGLRA